MIFHGLEAVDYEYGYILKTPHNHTPMQWRLVRKNKLILLTGSFLTGRGMQLVNYTYRYLKVE